MGKNKHKFDFEMGSVIKYFIKRFRILFTVSVLAFIISAVVSFIIKPKYKSTVIVFPTSPASVSKSIMDIDYVTSRGADILNFGLEDECDQLLQVFLSREIKDSMNVRFNLMQHYDIKPESKYAQTKYYDAFEDNFRFRRTEYNSLIIQVYDTDPVLAARMANEVVAIADSLYSRILRQRAQKAFELIQLEYNDLDSVIHKKEKQLIELSKMGIFRYKDQLKELTRAYYKAISSGKTQVATEIKRKMELAQTYGPKFTNLEYELRLLKEQQSSCYYKLTEARAELEQKLPNKFIVEHAVPADKKAWPRRTVLVLTSTIATFLLTLILLVFVDSIKKYV